MMATLQHRKHHQKRRSTRRFVYGACGAAILVILYLYVLIREHILVNNQQATTASHRDDVPAAQRAALSSSVQTTTEQQVLSPPKVDAAIRENDEPKEPVKTTITSTATLHSIPIQFHNQPPPASQVHCLGLHHSSHDTPQPQQQQDWMYRSCWYDHLCVDVHTHEYIVMGDSHSNDESSTTTNTDVALGVLNPRWDVHPSEPDRGSWKVQWRPTKTTLRQKMYASYYQLPDHTILLPFHSMAGHNVGHLVWDDLFGLYKLGRLYNYIRQPQSQLLLPIRHQLVNATLYANCDIQRHKRIQCRANFERFLPLLGVDAKAFSTTKQLQLVMDNDANDAATSKTTTSLVCARHGVAGLGLLQDHGWRDHGWDLDDNDDTVVVVPHNLGAGRLFYDYARLLQRHSQTTTTTLAAHDLPPWPPVVTFSVRSSRDWMRRQNFTEQIAALHDATVQTQALEFRLLSLEEQFQVAAATSIFVTTCGGGAVTATFLPRHAVLIVFYDATGGLDFARMQPNGKPARLDGDLLNHAGHLRVHWLPVNTANTPQGLELFVRLVRHEVSILERLHHQENDMQ